MYGILSAEQTALLICDVQGAFREKTIGFESMVKTTSALIKTATALGMPIVVTEQYPQRLQPTVEELSMLLPEDPKTCKIYSKMRFSMWSKEVGSRVRRWLALITRGR